MQYWKFLILYVMMCSNITGQEFVEVKGHKLWRNDNLYHFIGFNYWYGTLLASDQIPGGRERLLRELDQLEEIGVQNLRVMVESNGPIHEPYRVNPFIQSSPEVYDESILIGLDYLLFEIEKRNMTVVLVLTNYWYWTGGMAQYVSWATNTPIPYPNDQLLSWEKYMKYTAGFYTNQKCLDWFQTYVKKIVGRKNTITGKYYTEDKSIMSWQIANEPRGYRQKRAYTKWIKNTAGLIKKLDPNHLVSVGSEGTTNTFIAQNNYAKIHMDPNIDYLTAHVWVENWGWYDPTKSRQLNKAIDKASKYVKTHIAYAKELNKPLVFEEFGIARDQKLYSSISTVTARNKYFESIFKLLIDSIKNNGHLTGLNIWAWAGEGRPRIPGSFWVNGDPVTGDPPHEPQGWYSIYNHDHSTLSLIKKYIIDLKKTD